MQQTEEIPEFSLDDLPEPPKLEPELKEMDVPEPTSSKHGTKKEDKKEAPTQQQDQPKKESKGFLSKLFGKKKVEEKPAKLDIMPKPKEVHETVKLQTLSDDQFAPPGLMMADEINSKKKTTSDLLTKDKIDQELGPMPKMEDFDALPKHAVDMPPKHADAMPPVPPATTVTKEKTIEDKKDIPKHADDMPPAPPLTKGSTDVLTSPDVSLGKKEMSKKEKDALPAPPKIKSSKKSKKGIFGMFHKEAVKDDKVEKALEKTLEHPMPPPPIVEPKDLPKVKKIMSSPVNKEWYDEGVHFRDDEMEKEGINFLESEAKPKEASKQEPEELDFEEKEPIPVNKVKGVGPKTVKKLHKAKIKTAQHLATHDHKTVAKKAKIPHATAKKIVHHAKKITKLKKKVSKPKESMKKGITDIVKELEQERSALETLQKQSDISENTIIEAQSHKDIIDLLKKLEQRRQELLDHQVRLSEKEKKLRAHEDTYKRDVEYIENLKRRLDHDVRERTQYLINMEKEYFAKTQNIAKKKSELEIREKALGDKEKYLKEQEEDLKAKLNDLEDRSITVETKEKKLKTIMNDLEKQDQVLRDKEDDLQKREAEYIKKLNALETHERAILKELENKREHFEKEAKEVRLKEKELQRKEKNLDKKSVAMQYAKNIMEQQKSKLIDDEFEQYVSEQLQGKHGHIANMEFTDNLMKNAPTMDNMHTLIESCSDLVKTNKVADAKKLYNQIREQFYDQQFASPKEREAIHQMIRQLYDEITLADMGV